MTHSVPAAYNEKTVIHTTLIKQELPHFPHRVVIDEQENDFCFCSEQQRKIFDVSNVLRF